MQTLCNIPSKTKDKVMMKKINVLIIDDGLTKDSKGKVISDIVEDGVDPTTTMRYENYISLFDQLKSRGVAEIVPIFVTSKVSEYSEVEKIIKGKHIDIVIIDKDLHNMIYFVNCVKYRKNESSIPVADDVKGFLRDLVFAFDVLNNVPFLFVSDASPLSNEKVFDEACRQLRDENPTKYARLKSNRDDVINDFTFSNILPNGDSAINNRFIEAVRQALRPINVVDKPINRGGNTMDNNFTINGKQIQVTIGNENAISQVSTVTETNKPSVATHGGAEKKLLIVTANVNEKNAFLASGRFVKFSDQDIFVDCQRCYVGKFGNYPTVYLPLPEQGEQSANGARLTGTLIAQLRSMNNIEIVGIVMLGIAYGIDENNQPIGDILVSDKILSSDRIKYRNGKIIFDSFPQSTSRVFQNAFSDKEDWRYAIYSRSPAIHKGTILSGGTLLDDRIHRQQFLDAYVAKFPQDKPPIGGEMEGNGISVEADVADLLSKYIIVKSVCDYGFDKNKDGEEAKNEKQKIAADSVMSFAFAVFSRKGIFDTICPPVT